MWRQHKILFGDATNDSYCNDDCSCPNNLPDLCSTVIHRFLRKQQTEDPTWDPPRELLNLDHNASPVGFVDRFGAYCMIILDHIVSATAAACVDVCRYSSDVFFLNSAQVFASLAGQVHG